MPKQLLRPVLYSVAGRIRKLSRGDPSDEQYERAQNLGAKLTLQHPDHVANVRRLWKKVTGMKSVNVHKGAIKDLGLLWQYSSA